MAFPSITAGYTAALGLVLVAISAWVIGGRFNTQVLHGDGGLDTMNRRIRAHANFAEFVPLTLLATALLEVSSTGAIVIHALLLPLTVARVLHPFGMIAPLNSPQQYICRGASAIVTMLVLTIASVLLLLRVT
jgi:uncharacterized protein